MLYGDDDQEPELMDPNQGILLSGFQTIQGYMISPDPTIETWEWNPNWRYIKRVSLEGEVTGCFPMNIAMMLQFKDPIPGSRYMEWS
jgi:hypothetical protein